MEDCRAQFVNWILLLLEQYKLRVIIIYGSRFGYVRNCLDLLRFVGVVQAQLKLIVVGCDLVLFGDGKTDGRCDEQSACGLFLLYLLKKRPVVSNFDWHTERRFKELRKVSETLRMRIRIAV